MKLINIIETSFSNIEYYLSEFSNAQKFILTDENVFSHYTHWFKNYTTIVVKAGEEQKRLNVVEQVINQLLEYGADPSSILIGVGGGVICDLGGFIASIYMRGIPFCAVPTTLLAQVDAAIGGKTGVNTAQIKNVMGTFKQPQFTLIDTTFLKTLPTQELINGMAEVVKHACIADSDYFNFLETNLIKILALEPEALKTTITRSIEIKKKIVEQDPEESGLRKILNFGHTFGHAIEKHYRVPHGFAVAKGMMIANQIAEEMGMISQEQSLRVEKICQQIGLQPSLNGINMGELFPYIIKDKKKTGAQLSLILLNKIGNAQIVEMPIYEVQKMIVQRWK